MSDKNRTCSMSIRFFFQIYGYVFQKVIFAVFPRSDFRNQQKSNRVIGRVKTVVHDQTKYFTSKAVRNIARALLNLSLRANSNENDVCFEANATTDHSTLNFNTELALE